MRGYKQFVTECTISFNKEDFDSEGILLISHPEIGAYLYKVGTLEEVTKVVKTRTKLFYKLYKTNVKLANQKGSS